MCRLTRILNESDSKVRAGERLAAGSERARHLVEPVASNPTSLDGRLPPWLVYATDR